MRTQTLAQLPQMRIASPCPAKWDEMDGDDRTRFCHACKKHVYDLTSMGHVEIAALIERTEGRFCGRLYRRTDDRALTSNCPVGFAILKRRAAAFRARLAVLLLLAFASFGFAKARAQTEQRGPTAIRCSRIVSTLKRWACEDPRQFVLGNMSVWPEPVSTP